MSSNGEVDALGARYLLQPERFPEWGECEPFGPIELAMDVSGSRFIISGLSKPQERTIRTLWPEFLPKRLDVPAPASTVLSIHRAPDPTFRKLERWVYELDFDYKPASLRIVGLDLMARIEIEPSFRAALWITTEAPETFHGAFENFLRVVVGYAALDRGGALVHSAAVVDRSDDDAWLFIGHSGAGKSTVSRLGMNSGRTVLSDDLNPILPNDNEDHHGGGEISVVGSPFLGDLGKRSPSHHTLSGIYRLEQGTEEAVRAMGPAEMLASLMACSPYVNFDPYRREALCSNLVSLATRCPAHVLTFRRDGDFWPLLERRALVRS